MQQELVGTRPPLWQHRMLPQDGEGDLLQRLGLDWTVSRQPMFKQNGEVVEGYEAVVRDDTAKVLGIVTPQYQPLQNVELVNVVNRITENKHYVVEAGGVVGEGRVVFATLRAPELDFVLGPHGDESKLYLVLSTGHDGLHAMKACLTTLRVWCQNMLSLAFRNARSSWKVCHLGAPALHEEVFLRRSENWRDRYRERMNEFAFTPLREQTFEELLLHLMGPEPVDNKRGVTRYNNVREVLYSNYRRDPATGTAFGALQAVVEYYDWQALSSTNSASLAERRLRRSVVEPKKTTWKSQAYAFLADHLS